jgi:hypothetical protein
MSKIGATVFFSLFVLGFGAGGYFGISSLFGQLADWREMRSWHSTTAIVLEAALEESHGDSTTFRTTARYRYVVDGREYSSTRVGISEGSDNVGSWQHDQHRELASAQRADRSITVWYDPANPARAIVDRTLRWQMIAFAIPFATLFPMVSVFAFWMLVKVVRAPADAPASRAPEHNSGVIKADTRTELRALWFFATFWGLIAFPLGFILIPEMIGRSWAWLFVLIFPLVGVGLIWAALSRTVRLSRNGEVTLALSPSQPRLGESATVHATFDRTPPSGEYTLSLLCEKVDGRGEDTSYATVWQQERTLQVFGPSAAASFSPPAHLPASEAATAQYHRWRVLLTFPDRKDERAFDVTMQPAHSESVETRVQPDFSTLTGRDVPARSIPAKIAAVVEGAGLAINYNPANVRTGALVMLFVGLALTALGVILVVGDMNSAALKIFGTVFALIGVALLGVSAYSLSHRRHLAIAQGRLHVTDRSLYGAKEHDTPLDQVTHLLTRITGTTTIGSKRFDHHQIRARLSTGEYVVLASDIRDAGVARTLLELFRRYLPHAELGSDASAVTERKNARDKRATLSPESSARTRTWIKRSFELAVVLVMIFVGWRIFGGFFSDQAETPSDLQVEAPRR